jgi:hypothetical protein
VARLINEFLSQVDARSERGLASAGVGQLMERFGWTTRDVAGRFGVSERTARRWRQQDRIPERRAGDWQRETRAEARARTRQRIERRGIRKMEVTGRYRISKSRYRAGRGAPVRVLEGNKITPAQMRTVFAAVDAGDMEQADAALNQALAAAYDAPGLEMEDVESLDWGV